MRCYTVCTCDEAYPPPDLLHLHLTLLASSTLLLGPVPASLFPLPPLRGAVPLRSIVLYSPLLTSRRPSYVGTPTRLSDHTTCSIATTRHISTPRNHVAKCMSRQLAWASMPKGQQGLWHSLSYTKKIQSKVGGWITLSRVVLALARRMGEILRCWASLR